MRERLRWVCAFVRACVCWCIGYDSNYVNTLAADKIEFSSVNFCRRYRQYACATNWQLSLDRRNSFSHLKSEAVAGSITDNFVNARVDNVRNLNTCNGFSISTDDDIQYIVVYAGMHAAPTTAAAAASAADETDTWMNISKYEFLNKNCHKQTRERRMTNRCLKWYTFRD